MSVVGFPAAFLTGPALFVSLMSMNGWQTHIPVWLRYTAFCVIGTFLGGSVDEESLKQLSQWPVSLFLLAAGLLINFYASSFLLHKFFSVDKDTARLSSVPGHMSLIVSLSIEKNADAKLIVMIQSLRILCLTLIVPAIVMLVGIPEYVADAPTTMTWQDTIILLLAGAVLGFVLSKTSMPAPFLIGPMFLSTAAHLTGVSTGHVPQELMLPAILVVGSMAGSRFTKLKFGEFIFFLKLASIVIGVAGLSTILLGSITAYFTGLPLVSVLIAFSPGGLEAMIAMGSVVGADPTYIASHHLFRLFFLTALIAIVLRKKRS